MTPSDRVELDSTGLIVAGSPQIHDVLSTKKLNWYLVIAVLPAALWGVVQFGLPALAVLLTGVATAALTEALIPKRVGGVADGNAVAIGLMMSLMFPPQAPLLLVAVSAAFAIVVVKWAFGGLGHAILNPAIAGRVLAQALDPQAMNRFSLPGALGDGAPDEGYTAAAMIREAAEGVTPLERLQYLAYPRTTVDQSVTAWLNGSILEPLGVHLPGGYIDPFIGFAPGGIGEVSVLLLLVGSAFLIGKRVVAWHVPLAIFIGFAGGIATWGGYAFGTGFFSGDVLFHSLHGGIVFLMFFGATDNTAAPVTSGGMMVYGVLIGLSAALLRLYGLYTEGLAVAVLVVSFFVPLIDFFTKPVRFGFNRRNGEPRLYKLRG